MKRRGARRTLAVGAASVLLLPLLQYLTYLVAVAVVRFLRLIIIHHPLVGLIFSDLSFTSTQVQAATTRSLFLEAREFLYLPKVCKVRYRVKHATTTTGCSARCCIGSSHFPDKVRKVGRRYNWLFLSSSSDLSWPVCKLEFPFSKG